MATLQPLFIFTIRPDLKEVGPGYYLSFKKEPRSYVSF